MQRLIRPCLIVACLLCAALSAPLTYAREIVDMSGRYVTIPDHVTKIYSASYPLTVLFYAFAPDLLAGVNFPVPPANKTYLPWEAATLPAVGTTMGQGRAANPEEVMALHPDFIISWLDPFDDTGHAEQQFSKTGLPIVFVRMKTLADYPAALKFLGGLFDRPQRAEDLGNYISLAISKVSGAVASIPQDKRIRVYYAESRDGLATECDSSFHTEAIALAGGDNVEHCAQTTHIGMDKISVEEVIAAKPDLILALDRRFSDVLSETAEWRNVEAVKQGRVVFVPHTPFNWLDRPPSFMRALGIQWLAHVLYPDTVPFDTKTETKNFFHLFFGVDLSDTNVNRLFE